MKNALQVQSIKEICSKEIFEVLENADVDDGRKAAIKVYLRRNLQQIKEDSTVDEAKIKKIEVFVSE
ncbi:MAG: hypothetical protein K2F81_05685 [Ruminococcus sp.]|nr:hypothetical protein [Ruminococcus sp.]